MLIPNRIFRFSTTLIVAVTLLAPSTLFGDQAVTLEKWNREIDVIDSLLLDSEWKKARRKSQTLLGEMIKRVVRGSGARVYLGQVAIRQAVAFSGEGEADDAAWTMQVALQVLPSLREFPLDQYGSAGEKLENITVRMPGERPESEKDRPRTLFPDGAEIKPLKRIRGINPEFPWAKRSGSAFHVVVEVIVGIDGVPRHPVITKADGEYTAVCAVLNMMRDWRYRPVHVNGQPTEAFFDLKVRFNPHSV